SFSFFLHPAAPRIYPLSLHDALPIFTYEKRENILDSAVVHQLVTMARLIRYLADNDRRADSLWPEVLSYEFLSIPISTIWQTGRSEEHTSELQSRENLVCRLLLEKKK